MEDSTFNDISDDSDSIRVVSTDIENSQDIEVSNLEVSSDNDKDIQEISNVSADNTFATIQQQINSASAGSTIRLSGTYVGSGSQIILNKSLTIDGQGATLNGKNLSRIFNVTASNCIIKNIHFINGYDSNHQIETSGIIDWAGSNGCLINCTFTGAYVTYHGGSVYWRGDKGIINNCTFINSSSKNYGGSIYWAGGNGVVNNSNFIGSYGLSGGSIYWAGVNGTLSNSNFINSSVSNHGGSIYWESASGKIYNCSFNNSVVNTFLGGAIYCAGSNCSIENSTFFNCSVKSSEITNCDGGAIYVSAANFTINNCNFTSNSATRNGGGIAVSNRALNAKVENCIFDRCTASSGGAIYLDNITSGASIYKIISSTFKNCSANYAGAIYIIGDSNLIDYCNFLDCKATDSGGAISFACGNSVLNNSYFNNCHAIFAGAVYVSGDSNLIDCADFYNCNCIAQKTLVVSGSVSWAGNNGKLINSNFINSTVSCMLSSGGAEEITNAYGGSVSWYGSNGLIDSCNFINSTSNDTYNTYGGAIYWVGDDGKVIYSTFINSLSSAFVNGNGGAIYWDSTNGEIALCTFTNSSSIHSYSKGSSGGCAVYLNGPTSDSLLTNCTFENSHANNVSVIYSESTQEIYNSSFIMKSGDVDKDMVDGVSLDTLINQANKFVTKSIINTSDFSSKYGSKVNLTANVKNEYGGNINEGSVTFYKNGTIIGTANVVNGKATYTYTCDDVGIFDFKAVYTGSNNYGPSTATSQLYIENAILETTTSVNNTSSSYNKTVKLSASVKTKEGIIVDGGTVTFYVGNNVIGTADVVNGVATYSYKCNLTGTISIKAVYDGFNHFNPSNTTFTLNVAKLDTTVIVNPINANYGKSVDLSATVKVNNVNIDGGIVSFYVNNEYIGDGSFHDGVASCSYTPNIVGTFTYRAEYQGSDYYNHSNNSSNLHIDNVVTKVIVDPVYTNYGASANLSATVKTKDNILINTGTVSFYVNDSYVGDGTVNNYGVAICSYYCNITGDFVIRAVYNGPIGFDSSNNVSTLFVSSKGTITVLDFGPADYGDVVELVATVSASDAIVTDGTVKFYINNYSVDVDVVDGVARYNYNCSEMGTFNIKAVYSGSSLFDMSISPTKQLIIGKIATSTNIILEPAYYGDVVELSANVMTSDNVPVNEGTVNFKIGGNSLVDIPVVDGVARYNYTCGKADNVLIRAEYQGSDNFDESECATTLVVSNSISTVVDNITASYGETVTLKATIKTNNNVTANDGTVIFYVNNVIVGAKKNTNGVVTYSYNCNNGGNFIIKVEYTGIDKKVTASNGEGNLNVSSMATITTLNPISSYYNDSVDLSATVKTIDGTIINGGIVSFYVNDDYVGNDTVDSGFVTFTYNCSAVGNFTVKVVYEGSTSFNPSNNSFVLRVAPIDTNVIINNVVASYNDVVTLNATVKSADGSNVLGGIVSFYVDDVWVDNVTVVDGVAHCNYTCTNVGNFNIAVFYNGYDSYGSSNYTSSLKVNSTSTIVSIVYGVASYNDTVELIANVMTSDNVPVNGGIVSFYVDNDTVGEGTVVDGVAHCNYACTKLGNLVVRVEYKGTTNYTSSFEVVTLNVTKLSTVIVVGSGSASYNDSIELIANVMTSDNVPVNGGIVSFYVDSVCVGNVTVVDGVASYNYNCDKVGNFTITAMFTNLYGFEESSNTSTLNVSGLATVIVVDSVIASYNDTVTLRATVKSINNENINNGTVTFYINGTKVETVNINNGVATCSYTCDKVGDFTIESVYDGSDVYASSTNVSTLRVSGLATFTIVDYASTFYNGTVTLRATVKSNNVPVNGGIVSFYVDEVLVGNSSVSNGIAIYNYKCNAAGNFTIQANYSGCEYYAPSNYTSKLEVNSLNVILTPGTVFSSNFTANLVVNIKTEDGNPINEGNVTFYVDGAKVGTAKVSNGVATYKYHYDNLGEYEVQYVYSSSNNYNNNTSISTFKTSSLVTSISCNPVYTISGDVVTLTAYVSAEGNKTVNGGTVIFSTVNGDYIEPCIVSNGVASSNHIFNSYGVYNLTVIYNGIEGYFDQASASTTLTVGYLPTVTTVSSGPSTYGSTVTLTAKVTADSVVNDGQVTFYVGGTKIGSSSVNSNGVATYSYSCKKAGTLTIKAEYGNSKLFSASTGSSSLVVAKAQATMTVTVPSTCYYKGTKITIKLVDTKTKKVLANEKIAITIGTTTATVTTNANGVATYNVALVPKSYNNKFVLSSNNYNSNSSTKVIKIVKATSVTLAPTALYTTYNSKKAFQVKVYKGSVLFVGAKVKLKVYTGSKYKTVTITTGTNGIAQYKDASVLSVAKHKVTVSCGESTSYMTATAKTSYITVKKAPTTVSAPKVTNKYKKSAYFKVTVKMKSTGYTIPAGVAIKLKVYTGSKYKTYTVKTNSKGVASFNTQSLTVGTHKVVISSGHIYYTISATSSIVIKK